jgi:GNAT superfamily N-acetyltransferase
MIRYKVVDYDHKICQERCPDDVSHYMKKFWQSRELADCDGAVVVTKGGEIIAFFRYYNQGDWLYGAGTYVLGPYRSQGVAKKLWHHAIKSNKPRYIDVTATSAGAIKLLNSLKEKHKDIRWYIHRNF